MRFRGQRHLAHRRELCLVEPFPQRRRGKSLPLLAEPLPQLHLLVRLQVHDEKPPACLEDTSCLMDHLTRVPWAWGVSTGAPSRPGTRVE